MTSETGLPTDKPAKKPDLVSAPMTSVLVAVVVAAVGHSKGSELLTWQVPLGIVALAVTYTVFQVMRARR